VTDPASVLQAAEKGDLVRIRTNDHEWEEPWVAIGKTTETVDGEEVVRVTFRHRSNGADGTRLYADIHGPDADAQLYHDRGGRVDEAFGAIIDAEVVGELSLHARLQLSDPEDIGLPPIGHARTVADGGER